MSEADLIHWLRERLPGKPSLRLGIGDDAAVIDWAGSDCVATTDLLAEGVHFDRAAEPRRIGHKALAVNLSDLAAMAAEPVAALVSLLLPREGGLRLAKEIVEGMLPLAERLACPVAGGDTNSWSGPLVINVTALGRVTEAGALRRDAAQPGDRILVTGSLGGSLLERHLDAEPRVNEALALHRDYELHAGIDISDGLALDVGRVAAASGCGFAVDARRIPISEAAFELARRDVSSGSSSSTSDDTKNAVRRAALQHALSDGEDFELALSGPPQESQRILAAQPLDIPVTDVGEFTAEAGSRLVNEDGEVEPVELGGFSHGLG